MIYMSIWLDIEGSMRLETLGYKFNYTIQRQPIPMESIFHGNVKYNIIFCQRTQSFVVAASMSTVKLIHTQKNKAKTNTLN